MRTIRYKDIMRGRGTMTRQTVTQWRWWWVMTTVTRNNERQGQRVWGERILCTTQKMTMREQQQSTITINNHNQQSQSTINTRTTTMTRDDNKDEGKGQVMTRRTTRKERKACTWYVRQSWEQRGNTHNTLDINNHHHMGWQHKRCNKDKGKWG